MYTLTYRRRFSPFKKSIKAVIGHSYNEQTDKLWVATSSGGQEIMKWSHCEVYLSSDWQAYFAAQEKAYLTQSAKAE